MGTRPPESAPGSVAPIRLPKPAGSIRTAPETPPAGYQPHDDRRHRPPPGGKMRDSLFWEMIMPDEELGFQTYLYLTGAGELGFSVAVWGAGEQPLVLEHGRGKISDATDLDDLSFNGLTLMQPELRRTALLRYESADVRLEYDFTGLHDAFSYRQNSDGLPGWFAVNRFEQTGWVQGFLEFRGRRIEWDRIGHRDHSWGVRDWAMPQHWKWIVAYTADASRIVNGWIWIARGEWGFAGYVVRDDELVPISHIKHRARYDDDMTQRHLEAELVDIRGESTHLALHRFGIVKLPSSGKAGTAVIEAACTAVIDGRDGAGQFEAHWPTSYLEHLVAAGRQA